MGLLEDIASVVAPTSVLPARVQARLAGSLVDDGSGGGGGQRYYDPDQYLPDELRSDPLQLSPEEQLRRATLLEEALGSITSPGQTDVLHRNALKSFQDLIGRAPTAQEFTAIIPYFQGENGLNTGRAYLAQYADQLKNTPEALAQRAGQFSEDVGGLFQSNLGRDARENELDYYGRLLATGDITPYEVEQLIRRLPEYQTAQDTQFRQGLAGELEGYDTSFFNKAKQNVIGQANQGGIGQSSALDFALTQLMGDIAERRGQYLANLSSQQYGGNKQNAIQDYRATQNRFLRDQDYNRDVNRADQEYFRNRSDQNLDYQIQRRDYLDYLNSQRGRNTGYGQALGSLAGAGAGAFFGRSPQWAQAGSQFGGTAGSLFDFQNR